MQKSVLAVRGQCPKVVRRTRTIQPLSLPIACLLCHFTDKRPKPRDRGQYPRNCSPYADTITSGVIITRICNQIMIIGDFITKSLNAPKRREKKKDEKDIKVAKKVPRKANDGATMPTMGRRAAEQGGWGGIFWRVYSLRVSPSPVKEEKRSDGSWYMPR